MLLQNGVTIDIHKSFYNKTIVQEDGVTNIVDTTTNYPLYLLQINKHYMDIDNKEEVLDNIIKDLKTTIQELQQLKKQKDTEVER